MQIVLFANPGSGASNPAVLDQVRDVLCRLGRVSEVHSDRASGDDLRSRAGDADLVLVAGGDGSFNRALNVLRGDSCDVTFALIPMGTGNDLARTLEVPREPVDAARAIVDGVERSIDIGRATGPGVERLFANACMGGFPVEVDESVDPSTKKKLGPLAFWIGGAKAAASLSRFTVEIDGRVVGDCLAVGVGNGKTCGGGIEVWPDASPHDGLLNGCALAAPSVTAAAKLAVKVKSGVHEGLEHVATCVANKIEIRCDPDIEFNVDGELVGLKSPASFEVAGSIRMRL